MSKENGHGKSASIRPSLDAAIADAWEDAKRKAGGEPAGGTYKVELFIEADNPIRSYSVIITPVD